MKDRVPGAPGQYKAVVTDAELQKMHAGEQFTITMTRDDQPIVEGTPYSKAAVLPDGLAQSLCPDIPDPTPADAFLALHVKSVESIQYPGCYYRTVDGITEWINPPMVLGVEYRTTERWNGKAVYTKLFNFGKMPNAGGYAAVIFSEDTTISRTIRCEASCNSDVAAIFPAFNEGFITFEAQRKNWDSPQTNIVCKNNSTWNMNYFDAYVRVWYVK